MMYRYRIVIDVPQDSNQAGVLTEDDKVILVCEKELHQIIGFSDANQQ